MKKTFFSAMVLAFAGTVFAASPWRVPVHFAYTNDAGGGNSWFVVGNHPDVGYDLREGNDYWDIFNAVKLQWHDGNVWSADIAIQAGTKLKYKFIKRSTDASRIADGGNVEWMPGNDLELPVPSEPAAPYDGKRVIFLCDWPEPVEFCYSMLAAPEYEATNAWQSVEMTKTGNGRYELDGVGEAGEWMRFTFHHPGENESDDWWYHFINTEDEDFWSPLDAFCVADGQVFNYEPSQRPVADSYIVTTNVGSTADGIAGRDVRIYLPRGYDAQTNRSYPVVYFSDGQNVFQPGGTFGCWNAEITADREIRGGRMREAILVAVPCREGSVPGHDVSDSGRLWEYLPPFDCLLGIEQFRGLGGNYANFLIHNVKPTLDCHFRTRPGYEDTAHIGSSAGGLLTMYLGTCTNVFSLLGAMSGVYNKGYCPEFRRIWREGNLRAGKRIWLDTGDKETEIGGAGITHNLYESNFEAYDQLLSAGHVPNKDLKFRIGMGDVDGQHNETAWARRLWRVYDFLLDVRDEANPLLPLEISQDEDGALVFPAYGGTLYNVRRTDDICNPENAETHWQAESRTEKPWGTTNRVEATEAGFYWVEGE